MNKTPDVEIIRIDLNKETWESLLTHLPGGKNYVLVMTFAQFQNFKLIYKHIQRETDENGFIKEVTVEPTTMGYIYGIEYRVEN